MRPLVAMLTCTILGGGLGYLVGRSSVKPVEQFTMPLELLEQCAGHTESIEQKLFELTKFLAEERANAK